MLDGKLRIAPICYHVLHFFPLCRRTRWIFFTMKDLNRTTDGTWLITFFVSPWCRSAWIILGISQAMKEKSVDIALHVQSRTIFLSMVARRGHLHHRRLAKPAHVDVWVGPPDIQTLKDLKGKRVGISDFNSIRHWGIQVQLRKAGFDIEKDVEWVAAAYPARPFSGAAVDGSLEAAGIQHGTRKPSKRKAATHWSSRQDTISNGRPERIIAATGRILQERPIWSRAFSKGHHPILLVLARHAEEFRVYPPLNKTLNIQTADPEERIS